MSKLVARMAKMKAENLTGIQRHNQRETDNHSNPDIDIQRSHLNYDLVNVQSVNYRDHIRQIIDSQKISNRAVRKDAVLVDEWLITSDYSFFQSLTDSKKYFEDSLTYFSERCGAENIAYATVHLDETTPHMHLGIVPMVEGRLSSKQVFNRQALKEIQEELPNYLKERGHIIERGIKGSERKHLTVPEFKENQKEIKKMVSKVNELKDEVSTLQETQEQLDFSAQNFWHEEWLSSKVAYPDFEMMVFSSETHEPVIVNETTPRDLKMSFKKVFELFKEKFKQLKAYIGLKWQKTVDREIYLSNVKINLDSRENFLETKIEGFNEEIRVKEKQLDQLGMLIESKNTYIKCIADNSELSMEIPSYAKPSRLNKDMLVVPKDKLIEKHVSATAVSEMLRLKGSFEYTAKRIEIQARDGLSSFEVNQKNMVLNRKVNQLESETVNYWNAMGKLLNDGIVTKELANRLNLPRDFRTEFGLMENENVLNQRHSGPTR